MRRSNQIQFSAFTYGDVPQLFVHALPCDNPIAFNTVLKMYIKDIAFNKKKMRRSNQIQFSAFTYGDVPQLFVHAFPCDNPKKEREINEKLNLNRNMTI